MVARLVLLQTSGPTVWPNAKLVNRNNFVIDIDAGGQRRRIAADLRDEQPPTVDTRGDPEPRLVGRSGRAKLQAESFKRLGVFDEIASDGDDGPWPSEAEAAQPKEVVRSFFDRLDRHDVDGALALLDPAAKVEFLPLRLVGRADREGRAFLENLVSTFPDLAVCPLNVFATPGGTVVAEIVMEGTQAADFYGALNQRRHVDLRQAWRLVVTDGRVQAVRAYWCQNQLYRRLGVRRLETAS